MSAKSKFVAAVGKMPFTNRGKVKHAYHEGVRAAYQGDRQQVASSSRFLGRLAACNIFIAATNTPLLAIHAQNAIQLESALSIAEGTLTAATATGFAVSGIADIIIQRRLLAIPLKGPKPYMEPLPPMPRPTLLEEAVTLGGIFATIAAGLEGGMRADGIIG